MSQVSQVKCLHLPLRGAALLLPAAVVQEIVPQVAVQPMESQAPWHGGWMSLRGQRVLTLSMEALLDLEPSMPSLQQRVAVIHDIDNAQLLALRLFALPRIRSIGAADLLQSSTQTCQWGQWVSCADQRTLIPDLIAISALVRDLS